MRMSPRYSVSIALTAAALLVAPPYAAGPRTAPDTLSRREPPLPFQQQPTPAAPPTTLQQPKEVAVDIAGPSGAPPRYAVAPFVALSGDPETVAAAKVIGEVLWDDLGFEREFYMIARDVTARIPVERNIETVAWDRWREVGADAVIVGTVQKSGNVMKVQVRLFGVQAKASAFGKEYSGSAANPRLYAHTISDDIHLDRVALRGVARTKLAFSSDRDGERLAGSVEQRSVKELYISDYDGQNQRRVTVNRSLNITPAWSPDGRAIAYTSYARGYPDVAVSFIYQGTLERPAGGVGHNFLPAYSPDGTRLAFMSPRDGNPEIYVLNRDGSGLRRLTNHPGIDVSPTWSPNGAQIAFVSDRSGTPQIYVVGTDGLNLRRLTSDSYADRPTWSPAPFNEIAYAARTGPGYDIKILDLATSQIRQITFSEGSNESPTFAPNGRHLAFTTTRWGKAQIATVGRDGKEVRRITSSGNNQFPAWSP